MQTVYVCAPFIQRKYNFVQVIGKVEKIDYRESSYRLTISKPLLNKVPEKLERIRIRVNGTQNMPSEGDIVSLKATLIPPSLPYTPESYPYMRSAFYEKIGAFGYAMSKIKIVSMNESSYLYRIRGKIRQAILEQIPQKQAVILLSLTIGDQGLIDAKTRENYTASGIVHVLSVSGFHMGLIAGFVFFLLRLIFQCFPLFSLKHNIKKICAFFALVLSFFYLLISGMALPAVRSFCMVVLVLLGILFDRRACSLHSVFWVAFIILLFHPESLMSVSFALSFGAVIVLVASYETLYPRFENYFNTGSFLHKKIIFPFFVFLLMNTIVHFATAPIALYHFNRYANYGILGNFLTSILFSLIVIPCAFLGIVFSPFGFSFPFWRLSAYVLEIIDKITAWVASLPYASVYVKTMSDVSYGFFLFGVLWICLWKSKIKCLGVGFILMSFLFFLSSISPDLLVSQGGQIWAFRNNDGKIVFSSLSKSKKVRKNWLQSLGYSPYMRVIKQEDSTFFIQNKKINLSGDLSSHADLILNTKKPCLNCITRRQLWKEGTHAVYIKEDEIKIKTSGASHQKRPWGQ